MKLMEMQCKLVLLCLFANLTSAEVVQMPHETPRTLTQERLRKYIDDDVPFVFRRGDAESWRSLRLWDEEYITDRFHFSSEPGFAWGENRTVWDHHTRFIPSMSKTWSDNRKMVRPLERFFKTYEEGNGGKTMLSANLKCLAPELLSDFPLPWPVAQGSGRMFAAAIWPSLYIYAKGSALRMHVDSSSKWQYWTTLHRGSKHVRIISYTDWSEHLNKYFSPNTDGAKQPGLDIFKHDLDKNPELANVTVYEAVVKAGDEWYTPVAAAHAMIHLESPTINTVIKWQDKHHKPAVERLCSDLKSGRVRSSYSGQEQICNIIAMDDPTFPADTDDESAASSLTSPWQQQGLTFWEAFASPDFCHEVSQTCLEPNTICNAAFGSNHIMYCIKNGEDECAKIKSICKKTGALCRAAIPQQQGNREVAALVQELEQLGRADLAEATLRRALAEARRNEL
eukprot:m.79111 g.79111  ORF g.79111 m.79111 type:complete len:453 (-) comp25180_c0_seq1:99-1457(-)